jgi:hypothetical protein
MMSRLSQFFWFLNEERMPNKIQQQHYYTALEITDDLKAIRRKYRRGLKDLPPEIGLWTEFPNSYNWNKP